MFYWSCYKQSYLLNCLEIIITHFSHVQIQIGEVKSRTSSTKDKLNSFVRDKFYLGVRSRNRAQLLLSKCPREAGREGEEELARKKRKSHYHGMPHLHTLHPEQWKRSILGNNKSRAWLALRSCCVSRLGWVIDTNWWRNLQRIWDSNPVTSSLLFSSPPSHLLSVKRRNKANLLRVSCVNLM